MASDEKPAMQTFPARVNRANQRSEFAKMQKQSRVFIGRAGVKFAYQKTALAGVVQGVRGFLAIFSLASD